MLYRIYLALSILMVTTAFAQESSNCAEHYPIEDLSCIREISENRIYLNENSIYPTAEGLYLCLNEDGDMLLITELLSDSSGCYVSFPLSGEVLGSSGRNTRIFNLCPGCGVEYFVRCNNPTCPIKQSRDEKKKEKRNRD